MSDWFVRPDAVTLPLSEGHTLTVKRRLNAGETRAALGRMYLAGADGHMRINPIVVGLTTISAYLVDWTITDADGQKVEIRGQAPELIEATLDALDPDRFEEISTAVAAHEARQAAARAEEKKTRDGATGSPSISASLVAAGGP